MKNLFFFFLTTLFPICSYCQSHALKVGTQIPLQYNLGYEWQLNRSFSICLHGGILTKPYDKLIIGVLEGFGVDKTYTRIIENAFRLGVIGDASTRYHWHKNYIGIYGQFVELSAGATPSELIESTLGVNLDNYPRRSLLTTPNKAITFTSQLWQVGFLYGRRFTFKNPHYELRTEIAVSKNVASTSRLSSETREIAALQPLIDQEMQPIYKQYAYIPTLNLYFVYKF